MKFLVHSQLWMAFSGLALIASVASVHGVELRWESALIIFLGLMWVYLLDATVGHSPEDEVNQRARLEFFEKHGKFLGFVRMICLFGALYLALKQSLPMNSWIFFSVAGVCSWGYSVGLRGRRLKTLSLNKTWIVALAWTAGVFLAIWSLEFLAWPAMKFGLGASLLALLFFDTAALDKRDLEGDRIHGVQSVQALKWSRRRLHFGVAVFIYLMGLVRLFLMQDIRVFLMVISLSLAFVVGLRLAEKTKTAAWYSFWIASWRLAGLWVLFGGLT